MAGLSVVFGHQRVSQLCFDSDVSQSPDERECAGVYSV